MACLLDRIRTVAGQAGLAIDTALGDTLEFSHRGGNYVTLYCQAGAIGGGLDDVLDVRTSKSVRKFWVSAQTNFPPTDDVREGDKIRYRGVVWTITEITNADGIQQRYELGTTMVQGLSVQA